MIETVDTDEPAPPDEPTAARLETATNLRAMHTSTSSGRFCSWCLHPWPCPDRQWADHMLKLGEERRDDTH